MVKQFKGWYQVQGEFLFESSHLLKNQEIMDEKIN